MRLDDRAVLITGGARMGQAIATALAEKGCHVALTYHRSRESAGRAARAVRRLGRKALVLRADLAREGDIRRAVAQIRKEFKRLDILVNLASMYQRKSFDKLSPADWDQSLGVDLKTAYLLSMAVAPWMRKAGEGRIIHTSDWTARSGRPRYRGYVPYYVAKSGVIGLTEILALELAPEILVNAIAPGPMLPARSLSRRENARVLESTPLKRWGGAAEVAKVVLFLIESDFVTGECIRVDGGRHLF